MLMRFCLLALVLATGTLACDWNACAPVVRDCSPACIGGASPRCDACLARSHPLKCCSCVNMCSSNNAKPRSCQAASKELSGQLCDQVPPSGFVTPSTLLLRAHGADDNSLPWPLPDVSNPIILASHWAHCQQLNTSEHRMKMDPLHVFHCVRYLEAVQARMKDTDVREVPRSVCRALYGLDSTLASNSNGAAHFGYWQYHPDHTNTEEPSASDPQSHRLQAYHYWRYNHDAVHNKDLEFPLNLFAHSRASPIDESYLPLFSASNYWTLLTKEAHGLLSATEQKYLDSFYTPENLDQAVMAVLCGVKAPASISV